MTRIFPVTVMFMWFWNGVGVAADPAVQKTFEAERFVEYTISVADGDTLHRLKATRVKADGTIRIQYTPPQPVGRFETLSPMLSRLIRAADALDPGKLTALTAFEYFDCQEMILDAAEAFRDFKPWQQFVKNQATGAEPPSHERIAEQLRQTDVFRAVRVLFTSLGYCAQLSGFEKLAVRSIGPVIDPRRLAERGLSADPDIPVPLVLQFRLTLMDTRIPCPGVPGKEK